MYKVITAWCKNDIHVKGPPNLDWVQCTGALDPIQVRVMIQKNGLPNSLTWFATVVGPQINVD